MAQDEPTDSEGAVKIEDGAPKLDPFVDCPADATLTEIVLAGDSPPTIQRHYHATYPNTSSRVVIALVRGGAEKQQERPLEIQMNEQSGHTRWVVEDAETASHVLESVVTQFSDVERIDE